MTARTAARAAAAEPTTPAGIIAAATEAVTIADEHLQTLEQLVRSGDESVTIDDLEQARQQTGWARLRRDAAASKAEQLAAEQARTAYRFVLEENLETARSDPAEVAGPLLDEARELIRRALEAYTSRNRAVGRLAAYAADPARYREPGDDFSGAAPKHLGLLGSSFRFRGEDYGYLSASGIFGQLVQPLREVITTAEGGHEPAWLKELR